MLKHIVGIILLSVIVILAMPQAKMAMQALISGHHWVNQLLGDVFSGGQAGHLLRSLIALLSIPIIVGLIPAILYWFAKRSWLPCFMEIVWVVWLLQAAVVVMQYSTAPAPVL